ncbi:ABC transporter ATP-binding protein [Microvirga antarctica]|uniref:ABC transporter ATP-binding protein n=1 Tax=Microvirga antarctica TaxID=2819233 RepID=UPI001B30A194|nr:ABC transporter ATP-binding protein [Microvirga antarctica]
MERDPLRLTWKTTPWQHLLGFLVLALSGITLLIGLDLIRVATDVGVRAAAVAQDAATFLRLSIPLPREIADGPLVLVRGFALSEEQLTIIAIGGVVLVPLLIAVLHAALDWILVGIGARVIQRIRDAVLDASLRAPLSLASEVAALHDLAADDLSRQGRVLGASLLVATRLTGMSALALLYVVVTDWHAGLALALVMGLGAALNAERFRLRVDIARVREKEGAAIEKTFAELRHRIPAIRAHGTSALERQRVVEAVALRHRPVAAWERRLAVVESFSVAVILLAPLAILAVAAWYSPTGPASPGALVACALAAALAAFGIREGVQWRRVVERAKTLLTALGDMINAIRPRARELAPETLPRSGTLVAEGVSALDRASGSRIAGVDLRIPFPAHVALTGDGDAGPQVLASLLGGRIVPSTGHLTYGGVNLAAVDPVERARRIALAGDTVLIPGTLRDNLLYGCVGDAAELETRLADAVATTGLDRLTHARGLSGTLDPKREKKLAAAIVEARRAVHEALVVEDLDRFVDPFDALRYNRYATVGENLLFGKAIGDTFREDRLAGHPFIRAILEADDLTKPLARMGLSIAGSMIEIFADIPDGHPLFERFAFFSASDRPYFEDLVERRRENRRGVQTGRDQERLIGLALRYNESRHRLGLLDAEMEGRIVTARADLARMLPVSLQPAIEFYDQARLCAAASVQDNVLFGRVASDQAGAADAIQAVIRRVLTDRRLDADVARIGLSMPIDIQGGDLTLSDVARVDLVRCLVRRPDILVVQQALNGLPTAAAETLVLSLRGALMGRGLVLVTPEVTPAMQNPPFEAVIRFERGVPQVDATAADSSAATPA